MIGTTLGCKLLNPWQQGEELDDAVFQVAATFPPRQLGHKSYMMPGDELFGFDPNGLVQRLIKETGTPNVWEPIRTQIPEGGRGYLSFSASCEGQVPNQEREAKRQARDLLWAIWSRLANLDEMMTHVTRCVSFGRQPRSLMIS